MNALSGLPAHRPERTERRVRHAVEIREDKTGQILVVTSQQPLVAYQLDVDEAGWQQGEKHPDGVLLGSVDARSFVCFVELKSSMRHRDDEKQSPSEHGLAQVEGGIRHFHPSGVDDHGSMHHEAWRSGEDAISFLPDVDHEVVGIVVGFRQVPRPPPVASVLRMGSKLVQRVVVPIHGAQANRAEIEFKELLSRAGALV